MIMKSVKKMTVLFSAILLMLGCLTGCSKNTITGDWYSIDNPSDFIIIHEDNTFDIQVQGYFGTGQYTVKEDQLYLAISPMQEGSYTITTVDNVKALRPNKGSGDIIFVLGKENAEKYKESGITFEDK
ncbi:TPA: hypothetical protein TVE81_001534 [Streptococcus equi subsp. zooepidemicus]|nr:hypothetical protein [Streptococcus equi subsp. zooepidemicus]